MRGTGTSPMLARVVGVVAAMALVVGMAACGSTDGSATADSAERADKAADTIGLGKLKIPAGTAEEKEVMTVYGRFLEAHVHGRGEEACSLMTAKSRQLWTKVKPGQKLTCPVVMEKIAKTAGSYLKVGRLLNAKIGFGGNPNWAIVKYDDLYSTPSQIPLTRVGGAWKVDTYRNQMDIGTPET